MNCPAKTEPMVPDGRNQNPNELCSDLTTRNDLGRVANARLQREHQLSNPQDGSNTDIIPRPSSIEEGEKPRPSSDDDLPPSKLPESTLTRVGGQSGGDLVDQVRRPRSSLWRRWPSRTLKVLKTYCKFVGPGFMVSVAYIDPGNYATDVQAGASYRFKLLFMVLLSNIFAIFLQSLCITLGTVTGMNLAQMIKAHCPRWLNYISYLFAESAIIATDMAEVIGTAMALSMLSNGKIPLVAGCAISIVDVLFILLFYSDRKTSMTARRAFECFVAVLVLGVVICFCVQLSYIRGVSPGDIFQGYVPSSALVQGQGIYQACGILGATVMPHSLYLGSGLVQDRLKDFDKTNNLTPTVTEDVDVNDDSIKQVYQASIEAIRSCRWYSISECAISLFTFALFVNSAILIVAGASLHGIKGAANASLFEVYHLLSTSLAPAAGKVLAIALLLSGTSAGIVCTIAGQMVSEGQLRLKMKPWKRRLITRSISIIPSIIVAGALGGPGVSKALVGSQVALSVILPFVSAPLVWFTCRSKYMTVCSSGRTVQQGVEGQDGEGLNAHSDINMRVHPVTAFFAVLIWGVIVLMNVALLVLLGMGVT